MPIMLIKYTFYTNGYGTELTKVLDRLVIVTWTVNEVIWVVASRLRLAKITIGKQR